MNKMNYQKELDKILLKLAQSGRTNENAPTLLLHSCCAPCSSYCLEYLSKYFKITVYYYNPNITSKDEYVHRVNEQKRLIDELNIEYSGLNSFDKQKESKKVNQIVDKIICENIKDNASEYIKDSDNKRNLISFVEGDYDPIKFLAIAKGLEDEPEGGKRCFECFKLRLSNAANYANQNGFDFITTTLSISPLKDASKLNEIGLKCTEDLEVNYLCSDFKKKEGYKRSIELSQEHNLYRQNYCGCSYSKINNSK